MVGIDVAENRKKSNRSPSLLVGDSVEVRSLAEGFMGSWHSGVVIHNERGFRKVQYKNLLPDDESQKFNYLINVRPAVDGITSVGRARHFYRGLIRPIPPHLAFDKLSLHYGHCVDAYYREAWWEGVIFDNENASDVRSIFFPDIGDLMRIQVDNVRITQDWDECNQEWKPRGNWYLIELIKQFEKENLLHVSARQIWYEMREKKSFQLIKEWTNSVSQKHVWVSLLTGVIKYHAKLATERYYREVAELVLSMNNEDLNVNGKSLVCGQFPSNGKRKRKWEIAGTEVNTVKEIHGDDLNEKHEWKIAGKELLPEAEFCPSSVLEYLSTKKNMSKLKLRKHLAYLGWKIENCTRYGKKRMRYSSPDGKTYTSLVTVCKNWNTITSQSGEKCAFSPLLPRHHIETSPSSISIEPMQDIEVGDEVSGELIACERTCGDNDGGAQVNVVPPVTEEEKIDEDRSKSKSNIEEEGEKLDKSFSSSSGTGIHVEVLPSAQSINHNNSFMSQDSNTSNDLSPLLFERPVEKINYYECQIAEHEIVPEAGILPDSTVKLKINIGTTHEEIPCSLPLIVPCNVAISVNEISRQEEINIVEKELPDSNNNKWEKHNWETASTDVVPEAEECENTACPKSANYEKLQEMGCNLIAAEAYAEGEVYNGVEKALVSDPKQNINVADEAFDKLFYSNLHLELDESENGKSLAIVEHQNVASQDTLPSGMSNSSITTAYEPKQDTNVAEKDLGTLIGTHRFSSNLAMEPGEFEKENSLVMKVHQNEVSQYTFASGMTNSSVATAIEAYNFDGKPLVSRPKQNIKIADEAFGKLVDIQRVPTNLQMEFGEIEISSSFNSLDQIIGRKICSSEAKEKEEFALSLADKRSYFSRLIDSGVVSPGAKVSYYGKKSGAFLKEGQITRKGIMCNCCKKVFGLSKFEAHAGSTMRRPAANLFLEDGTTLSQCQLKLKSRNNLKKTLASPPQRKSNNDNIRNKLIAKKNYIRNIGTPPCKPKSNANKVKKIATPSPKPKRRRSLSTNDSICSVCQLQGKLILCHQCPSSFHQECLNLKDIPDGEWFCLSCCCGICGRNKFNAGAMKNMEGSVLNCHQCERIYHVGCLFKQGDTNINRRLEEKWFCNNKCEQIFLGIRKLVGKPVVVGDDNLTWTLLKYTTHIDLDDDGMDSVAILSNLNLAVSLIYECFGPLKEPRTEIDIAKEVIFSRGSNVKRLNFQGFYTVLLSRDDELISVAAVRVKGEKVAEVPLIGTRFQYRRKGMCRLLMNVLEKKLMELGVERLVVPTTPNVRSTWTTSFGLLETTRSERLNFLNYTFLDFPGTAMCHKILSQSAPSINICAGTHENIHESVGGSDNADINKKIESSEIFQAEQTEDEVMYQGAKTIAVTSGVIDGKGTPLILRR